MNDTSEVATSWVFVLIDNTVHLGEGEPKLLRGFDTHIILEPQYFVFTPKVVERPASMAGWARSTR